MSDEQAKLQLDISGDGNVVGDGSSAQVVKAEGETTVAGITQIRGDVKGSTIITAGRDVIQQPGLYLAEDWLRQIHRTFYEWLSATIFRRRYLRRYRQTLITNLRDLKVIGKNRPLDLEQIYIALRIIEYAARGMVPDTIPEEAEKPIPPTLAERYSKATHIDQALEQGRFLAILGEPGSGKTTLLKHLALRTLKQDVQLRVLAEYCTRRTKANEALDYPLPILVTLNDFARYNKGLSEYLVSVLAEHGFPFAGQFLRQQIEHGQCLLLLDGLDEVAEETKQDRVIQKINAFVQAYADRNRVLVTSRIAGFRHRLHNSFTHLEVVEFGQKEVEAFVRNWFTDHAERAQGLLSALHRSRRMQALAANPLLLSIIAVVYEQGWRLPERRVDLYEECTNVLCEKWDQIWGRSRPSLYKAKWQIVLEDLALGFSIQKPPKFIFTERELLETLSVILPQHGIGVEHARRFLNEVMEQTGLLRQKSRTTFDFVHLTFHEYFAARAIARLGMVEIALANYREPQWQEVILLLAGIMRNAAPIIDRILAKGEIEPGKLILAARCLADADQTEPTRREALIKWVIDELILGDSVATPRGGEDVIETLGDEGLAKLLSILENDNSSDRLRRVANALGTSRDSRAIPGLVQLLDSDDTSVLEATADALSKIGTSSFEPLVEALARQKWTGRQTAALALGELGDTRAVPHLLQLLQRDGSPEVRGQAVISLGSIGDKSVTATLEECLVDQEPTVRHASAITLGRLADSRSAIPLMHTLRDVEPQVAQAAADALQRLRYTTVDQLQRELSNEKIEVREAAVLALGYTNVPQAIIALKQALSDSSPYVRVTSARVLGKMGEPVLADVEELLQRPNAEVRAAAALALGYIGASQSNPRLRQTLTDEAPIARAAAIIALARLGEKIFLFLSEERDQNKATIEALYTQEEIPVSDAVDALVELLETPRRYIREAAAIALVNLARNVNKSRKTWENDGVRFRTPLAVRTRADDMRQAIPRLEELLRDPAGNVRKTAAMTLGQLEHSHFRGIAALMVRFLSGSYEESLVAAEGLRGCGEVAVKFLIRALRHRAPRIRERAAKVLGLWAENSAIMPLIGVLNHADVSVRVAAIEALGRIGNKQTVNRLTQMLEDSEPCVRLAAIQALVEIGDEHAIEGLKIVSQDRIEEIADAARKGIQRIEKQYT